MEYRNCHFAPRQSKNDSKFSIVSMAHPTVGIVGKVAVVGAGFVVIPR